MEWGTPVVRQIVLTFMVSNVLLSASAQAFVCTRASASGPSLAWGERNIELRVSNVPGAEIDVGVLEEALGFAVEQWTDSDSCSDMVLSLGEITNHKTVGFDWAAGADDPANKNIVVFRKSEDEATVDRWLHPLSAIALTTVTYVNSNGTILDADIELNDAYYTFTNCDPEEDCAIAVDLKNTLTHEVGHVLGLDHPPFNAPESVGATMASSAPEGEIEKRDLAEDDINGLCFIYPFGEDNQECYGASRQEPLDVTIQKSDCQETGLFGELAIIGGLPWLLRRRRRIQSRSVTRGGGACRD